MDTNWTKGVVVGASIWAVACGDAPLGGDGSGGGSSAASLTGPTASGGTATTAATDSDSLGTGGGSMGQADAADSDSDDTAASMGTVNGGESTDATTETETETDSTTMGTEESMGSSMAEPGCGGIDFLFVIDNSGSMAEQQSRLLESFPGFIAGIEASLGQMTDRYHVGVVTSDAYAGNQPGCTGLGDLVTQTEGMGSSEQECTPFSEGHRFATEADDLSVAFPCMAQVGIAGSSYERPVAATIAALEPARNSPGGCNEGFLREDAILVVVVLTDDPPWKPDVDDAHPGAETSEWYDEVLAAKGEDPDAVVVLGFIPWDDVSCVALKLESPNLIDFVMSFGEQGVLASICEDDYASGFSEAVAAIVTTCEEFEPPA